MTKIIEVCRIVFVYIIIKVLVDDFEITNAATTQDPLPGIVANAAAQSVICSADSDCVNTDCSANQTPVCGLVSTMYYICKCKDKPKPVFSDFVVLPVRSLSTAEYWSLMNLQLTIPSTELSKYTEHVIFEVVDALGGIIKQLCIIEIDNCTYTPPAYVTDFNATPPPPSDKCECRGKEEDVYDLFVKQKAHLAQSQQFVKAKLIGKDQNPSVNSSSKELPIISHVCRSGNPCNGHECYQQYRDVDTMDEAKEEKEDEQEEEEEEEEEDPGFKCNCVNNFNGFMVKNRRDWKKGKYCTEAHACSDDVLNDCGSDNKTCERLENNTDLYHCVLYEIAEDIRETQALGNVHVSSKGNHGPKMMLYQIIGWLFVIFSIFYLLPTVLGEVLYFFFRKW